MFDIVLDPQACPLRCIAGYRYQYFLQPLTDVSSPLVHRVKDKTRVMAHSRRQRENDTFTDIAEALPIQENAKDLDKASILRVAIHYLKLRDIVGETKEGVQEENQETGKSEEGEEGEEGGSPKESEEGEAQGETGGREKGYCLFCRFFLS